MLIRATRSLVAQPLPEPAALAVAPARDLGIPRVNQHLKRDRLPSAAALAGARTSIMAWWGDAWMSDPALQGRFEREATAALPVPASASPEDIFAALEWRRLRLRQDQQVQEWQGTRA